jgi:predicted O-methyltransferase YrrM
MAGEWRMNVITLNTSSLAALPFDMESLPAGWLAKLECQILYSAAKRTAADGILEVGSWIGRSSCAIAYGVRDSQAANTRFDIVDYGIAGVDEWQRRLGPLPTNDKNAQVYLDAISAPGGIGGLLKQNLVRRKLEQFVDLIVLGDILKYETQTRYGFVFCDATHGLEETRRNIPFVRSLLREEFVLICDDVIDSKHLGLINEIVQADACYTTHAVDSHTKFGVFTAGRFAEMFA